MTKLLLLTALIVLLVICGFHQLVCSSYAADHGTAIAGNDEWSESNYKVVLDMILPSGEVDADEFPGDARWVVTVRIEPSHGALECGFSLTKFLDGRVEAVIVSPQRKSILEQLRDLKKKSPSISVEQASKMIVVQRQKQTSQNCPQLNRLAASFEAIRMSPSVEDNLRLDGIGYAIWSQARWGNTLRVRLGGPGQDARVQPHPLLDWVETFRKRTKSCS